MQLDLASQPFLTPMQPLTAVSQQWMPITQLRFNPEPVLIRLTFHRVMLVCKRVQEQDNLISLPVLLNLTLFKYLRLPSQKQRDKLPQHSNSSSTSLAQQAR